MSRVNKMYYYIFFWYSTPFSEYPRLYYFIIYYDFGCFLSQMKEKRQCGRTQKRASILDSTSAHIKGYNRQRNTLLLQPETMGEICQHKELGRQPYLNIFDSFSRIEDLYIYIYIQPHVTKYIYIYIYSILHNKNPRIFILIHIQLHIQWVSGNKIS